MISTLIIRGTGGDHSSSGIDNHQWKAGSSVAGVNDSHHLQLQWKAWECIRRMMMRVLRSSFFLNDWCDMQQTIFGRPRVTLLHGCISLLTSRRLRYSCYWRFPWYWKGLFALCHTQIYEIAYSFRSDMCQTSETGYFLQILLRHS